jgi:uncharacterized iron-regulated membrane protein
MKRFIKQLHIWLSIPLGVIISIICFTGAILIFEPEITEQVQSEYYYVDDVEDEPIDMEELRDKVEATLDEGESIRDVVVDEDPERTYMFKVVDSSKGGKKAKPQTLYVDQYSGEVLGTPERLPLFREAFRLHRWLMDVPAAKGEMTFGKLVVGISTLAMVILLISGIVLWWPKGIKMLKNRTKVSLTKGWRRFNYDLHVSAGMYATILLLIMALTGLVWSFEWYKDGFYALIGDGAREWLRGLHTGSIGGIFTKVLWFIGAIIGGMLPITGYYMWIKRKFCKRKS